MGKESVCLLKEHPRYYFNLLHDKICFVMKHGSAVIQFERSIGEVYLIRVVPRAFRPFIGECFFYAEN